MTASTLTHRYVPRGAARELLECRDPELLVSGPAGTGKSRACLEKGHLLSLLNPGAKGLILRKTLASLGGTALATWRTYVVPEALAVGVVHYYGGSSEEPPQYRYENGSSVAIGGLDKPSKIMSSEYDWAFVQEATELTVDDWEAVNTRLRNGRVSFQQLLADCNPDAPTHWLLDRCNTGACTIMHSRHEDNPRLFNETTNPDGTLRHELTDEGRAYIGRLDRLTGVRYQRLRLGRWVAAEGLIFEDWDPAVHLVDRYKLWGERGLPPDNWMRWWSVDFGYVNPMVVQMWAEDGDGRLYLYRELYATKKTVDQFGLDTLRTVADEDPARPGRWIWREPKPRAIICDHDAEGRVVLASRVGIGTVPAKKGITDGIQAVQGRLKPAGDGKPRLFICRSAIVRRDQELVDVKRPTCTEEEIPAYVWDTVGATTKNKAPKETPLKDNDHGCDALRYLCAEREVGAPRLRMM